MKPQDPTGKAGFSRRAFLKGSAAAATATAAALGDPAETQAATARANVLAAELQEITLNVNGTDHKVKVEPRSNLMDVLRNDLNLTGCKDVCDTTSCGACTVIIDGKATYACSRFAVECQGTKIRTVESLRNGDQIDPVIAGFSKHDAMQCGFCTPGFVVATRAFIDQNPGASLEDIQKGLGGNLCRCGTYHGITHCALELARKGGA